MFYNCFTVKAPTPFLAMHSAYLLISTGSIGVLVYISIAWHGLHLPQCFHGCFSSSPCAAVIQLTMITDPLSVGVI
jgi:hypothetical protein